MLTPNQTIIRHFSFNFKTVIFAKENHELLHHNFSRCLPEESTDHGVTVCACIRFACVIRSG